MSIIRITSNGRGRTDYGVDPATSKVHGREAGFEFLFQKADLATQFACAPSWLSDDELALAVQKMEPTQRARLLDAIEAVSDEEEDEG